MDSTTPDIPTSTPGEENTDNFGGLGGFGPFDFTTPHLNGSDIGRNATVTQRIPTALETEQAKNSACEMYKLMGDYVQMRKIGCPNTPKGPKLLVTIPLISERGRMIDQEISDALRFIMLGILLGVAACTLFICCCRTYRRIIARRALMQNQFRNTTSMRTTSMRAGSSVRPCCGGRLAGLNSLMSAQDSYRPMFEGSKYKYMGDECHVCSQDLNLV